MDETYTRSMSEPLETTPCNRPSASSTKGTFASLRGWTGGSTRTMLRCSPAPRCASTTLDLPAPRPRRRRRDGSCGQTIGDGYFYPIGILDGDPEPRVP